MKLRLCTALLAAAALAGCTGEQADRATGPLSPRKGGGVARRVMPNSMAYGRGGIRPAHGRSGSAAILAAAYAGAGTVLMVTSYRSSDLSFEDPAGDIVKLQVKAFTAAGRKAWTRNFNHLAPPASTRQLTLSGLEAGMRLQVTAHVRGIDGRRTDVVTTSTFVVAKPANLRLVSVQADERWFLGVPLPVTALVSETGGDLDVTASCALYVDGTLAERIANVLVLAGDQVSCNFAPTFTTIGTHELRVALEGMSPGDNNPLDNQTFVAVDVYAPEGALLPVFNYSADVSDVTLSEYDSSTTRERDLASGLVDIHEAYVTWSEGREQSSAFNGVFASRLAFPVARLVLVQRSGATVLHADTLENLPQNGAGLVPCTVGTGAGGVEFSLCSDDGMSALYYVKRAGTVAYRTQRYNLLVDPELCASADGCWVLSGAEEHGAPATWGSSLSYEVSITAGDTVLGASPTVPLGAINEQTTYGPACETAIRTDSLPGPFGTVIVLQTELSTCSFGYSNRTGLAGAASGVGVSELVPLP